MDTNTYIYQSNAPANSSKWGSLRLAPIKIGVAMQPEVLVAATLAVSQELNSFTTNHTSILKIARFNAQNVAQFDA